jgi:hypothetical protein
MIDQKLLETIGYRLNDRTLSDIRPMLVPVDVYSRLEFLASDSDTVYTGAEHTPQDLSKKLPNLTLLPNLYFWEPDKVNKGFLFGTTFGHHHDMQGLKQMQELYEFHGYGAMVLDHDNESTIDFIVAKAGDKVSVPNRCHMTLYNLDETPLITADYANPLPKSPLHNAANKDLQKQLGPILFITQEHGHFWFRLNEKYINPISSLAKCYGSGVRLPQHRADDLLLLETFPYRHWYNLGEQLYFDLTKDTTKTRFEEMGINILKASPEIEIFGVKTSENLLDIALGKDRLLQNYFEVQR